MIPDKKIYPMKVEDFMTIKEITPEILKLNCALFSDYHYRFLKEIIKIGKCVKYL